MAHAESAVGMPRSSAEGLPATPRMNDVASTDPRSDQLSLRAFAALQVADHESAEECARLLVNRQPSNANGLALLALALRGRGRFGEAEESARKALEIDPGSPDLEFVLGLCVWNAGDPAEARKRFESALEKRPDRSDMLMEYSAFLLHQRQFEQALEQARKARDLAPDHPKLPLLLSCAEQGLWRPEVDMMAFRPPLPLPEDSPETFVRLGASHMDAGYFDLALDEFSRALDLDVDHQQARALYATTFYMRKNGFFAWARNWRRSLKKPLNLILWTLPAVLLFGGGYALYQGKLVTLAAVSGGAGLAYLSFLLYTFARGGLMLSSDQFGQIVQYRNLTPQGRQKQAAQAVDELDEVRDARRGRRRRGEAGDWARSPAHVPQNTGTGGDPSLVRRQLEDRSRTLWNYSNSFFGLFVVAGLVLIWTVIRKNTPGMLVTEEVRVVERISAGVTTACVVAALWFRMKARELTTRL